jgi:formate hydrogenlyase subunit 6/NADH:ubiquinone oxidoreductase subunit I
LLGIGLVKGLKTTLRAFFSKPVTLVYPYRKIEIADRGQGLIRIRMTQLDPPVYKCTGCRICDINCPQHCITVVKKEGEKQPEIYTVNYGLCMFCRICIDVCPFNALQQTQEHEFIGESRQDFIRNKEELAMKSVYIEEKKEENKTSESSIKGEAIKSESGIEEKKEINGEKKEVKDNVNKDSITEVEKEENKGEG